MSTTAEKRKALGRGLESLLPGGPRVVSPAAPPAADKNAPGTGTNGRSSTGPVQAPAEIRASGEEPARANSGAAPGVIGTSAIAREIRAEMARQPADGEVITIALDLVDPNPYQTRVHIEQQELQELADSIKVSGVLQPIVVRPSKEGRYLLIVGERRCRAAKLAGLATIPATLRIVSDEQAAEMTIVENLQRADLNPLEQAQAFTRLSRDFGLTQEQIGLRIGMSRESVSNYMRLTRLPEDVQLLVAQRKLEFSTARLLLSLDTPAQMSQAAMKAVEKRMSVEQLESLIFHIKVPLEKAQQEPRSRWVDPNVRAAQQDLERTLGVRVRIRDRRGKGKIVIEYATLEDFDRVLEMLKGK
jgi:ParB family transcriptional regulator, chromosome partitioning protein